MADFCNSGGSGGYADGVMSAHEQSELAKISHFFLYNADNHARARAGFDKDDLPKKYKDGTGGGAPIEIPPNDVDSSEDDDSENEEGQPEEKGGPVLDLKERAKADGSLFSLVEKLKEQKAKLDEKTKTIDDKGETGPTEEETKSLNRTLKKYSECKIAISTYMLRFNFNISEAQIETIYSKWLSDFDNEDALLDYIVDKSFEIQQAAGGGPPRQSKKRKGDGGDAEARPSAGDHDSGNVLDVYRQAEITAYLRGPKGVAAVKALNLAIDLAESTIKKHGVEIRLLQERKGAAKEGSRIYTQIKNLRAAMVEQTDIKTAKEAELKALQTEGPFQPNKKQRGAAAAAAAEKTEGEIQDDINATSIALQNTNHEICFLENTADSENISYISAIVTAKLSESVMIKNLMQHLSGGVGVDITAYKKKVSDGLAKLRRTKKQYEKHVLDCVLDLVDKKPSAGSAGSVRCDMVLGDYASKQQNQ